MKQTISILTGILLISSMLQAQSKEPVILIFAGDVTLSDNVESYVGGDIGYVFRKWRPGDESDIFMVNLEHPVTRAMQKVEKTYNFKMDPAYLATLTAGGVTLVNCANNHVFDYGVEGITETIRSLDSAGIKRVGVGLTIAEARRPVILEVRGRKIGFLGYFGGEDFAATTRRPGYAPRYARYIVEDVKKLRAKTDFVVVNFHWGTERAPEPDSWQVQLAHRVIDAGADLIVGHHPHILQGIERYNGKYVAYSLGNFVFGGNTLDTYDTAVLKVIVGDSVSVSLVPVRVEKWQPVPAEGKEKQRTLQLVMERSGRFANTIFEQGATQ